MWTWCTDAISVVVCIVWWAVVNIVVHSRAVTDTWNQRPGGSKRSAPLILVVPVQIHAVAALIDILIGIWDRSCAGDGVVPEVLSPSTSRAFLICCRSGGSVAVVCQPLRLIIDQSVCVQYGYEVYLTQVDHVRYELLRKVLVHTEVAGPARHSIAI